MDTVDEKIHPENFSLAEFFNTSGETFLDRVEGFSRYYRQSLTAGLALYGREITGPPGPRVMIRDQMTGEIKPMIMLGSNDYLGLTNHPRVIKAIQESVARYGAGMGGPPLLNGMSTLHRDLEQRLARLKGAEDCLLFASGFQANLGWITSLLRSGDILIYDELNHASLYDGIKILRATAKIKAHRFTHNDTDHLAVLLEQSRKELKAGQQIFVAVEGVYSMNGDLAPLSEIASLCREHGALLVLDDAHGTGVMGETGAGTAEHFGVTSDVAISMGTFSKAFGVTGGFITAKKQVIDYLRFFARSYMFSAHLPQSTVAAVLEGLDILEQEPERVRAVRNNTMELTKRLAALGYHVSSEAAIIPVPIPEHIDIRILNRRFHEEGLFVNSIEYPAVPMSEQRLRLSLMANHTAADIDDVARIFEKLGHEFNLI